MRIVLKVKVSVSCKKYKWGWAAHAGDVDGLVTAGKDYLGSEEGKIFINKFNAQFGGQGMGRKNL